MLNVICRSIEEDTKPREWAEQIAQLACENLLHDGKLAPVFFVLGRDAKNDRTMFIIPTHMFFESDEGKDIFAVLATRLLQQLSAEASLLVSEAWMSQMRSQDLTSNYVPPSEDPQHKEVLLMIYESRFSGSWQRTYELVREDAKLIGVNPQETIEGHVNGRFGGFFTNTPGGDA